MSKYFRNFPTTPYKFANSSFSIQKSIVNISLKTVLTGSLPQDDPYLYLRYTVKDGEKAEDVSDFYYDDPGYVWLVYFANDIIDPYTQWPKDYDQFVTSFRKKYASKATEINNYDPIYWGKKEVENGEPYYDNVVHWKKELLDDNGNVSETYLISPNSYTRAQTFNQSDFVAGDWTAVRYFDYEMEENEKLRNIILISDRYVNVAEENLVRLLNG